MSNESLSQSWPSTNPRNLRILPIKQESGGLTPRTQSLSARTASCLLEVLIPLKEPPECVIALEGLAMPPAIYSTVRQNGGQAVPIDLARNPTTTNGRDDAATMHKGIAVRAVCPRTGARMLELSWFWCPGVRLNAQPLDNHDVDQRRHVPR